MLSHATTMAYLCTQKSQLAYKSIQTKKLVETLNTAKLFSSEEYVVQFDYFLNSLQRSAKKYESCCNSSQNTDLS